MKTKLTKAGFTLVEILIVVVILGILAAIVIPQFTQASTEARENSLKANLQTIRSQIELYKIQHNDNEPTFANFVAQMTGQTNVSGAAGTDFGPYLQSIPVNPFTNTATLDNTGTAGDDVAAWEYDESDGSFNADDSGTDTGGTDHADY
ncbi:MAG: competence type IV pilus major pilin ComGC [Planctomycetota bacterium]|jgi:general secretion pathway protein G